MTSILKVSEIQDPTNSNTALTINSNGLVTPKAVASPAAFQVNATDTDQSYTASAFAKITWENVLLDTGSYWDSSNHRYTPQVAGWYLFGGTVRISNSTVTLVAFNIRKNGAADETALMNQFQTASDTFTNGEYPMPTGLLQMNGSSDYVEAYFQSEENCTIHDSSNRQSIFWGHLVHAT
tara:strand:+ start:1422 stop:1961 length:540 start_codon:yes stop_codon:yes gene_type:complete